MTGVQTCALPIYGAGRMTKNHLVGYNPPRTDAALVHYTLGGPYFSAYEDCEYADDWRRECDAMLIASAGVSGGKKP